MAEQVVRIVKETHGNKSVDEQEQLVNKFCETLGVYLLGEHD